MIAKVVGMKPVSYTSKKTGNPVTGTYLYLTYTLTAVTGLCVDTIFISGKAAYYSTVKNKVTVGSDINLEYDNRGNLWNVDLYSPLTHADAPNLDETPFTEESTHNDPKTPAKGKSGFFR